MDEPSPKAEIPQSFEDYLLDSFAGQALAGLLASPHFDGENQAGEAYAQAEAMVEERARRKALPESPVELENSDV